MKPFWSFYWAHFFLVTRETSEWKVGMQRANFFPVGIQNTESEYRVFADDIKWLREQMLSMLLLIFILLAPTAIISPFAYFGLVIYFPFSFPTELADANIQTEHVHPRLKSRSEPGTIWARAHARADVPFGEVTGMNLSVGRLYPQSQKITFNIPQECFQSQQRPGWKSNQ